MSDTFRAVKLLRNQLYPTYQLFAKMANSKTKPQEGLRLGALITMRWLAQRMGDQIPPELENLPEPSAFKGMTDNDIPSFHTNQGYVIDIVSLPEHGMWTLQITEPDLGSDPGNPEQERAPVPGRIIETHIAFRVVGSELECGFKTIISDPEGTPQKAEVYRLAIIRQLIRNPDFGLKHITNLSADVVRITSAEQVKNLLSIWHDASNQIPCVVFSQVMPEAKQPQPSTPADLYQLRPSVGTRSRSPDLGMPNISVKLDLSMSAKLTPLVQEKQKKKASQKTSTQPKLPISSPKAVDPPYDVKRFAQHGESICRTYLLEDSQFSRFCQLVGTSSDAGAIFVLEPDCFGGKCEVIPFKSSKTRQDEIFAALSKQIFDYPLGKAVSYGSIAFLSAAREDLLRSMDDAIQQSEQLDSSWEQKLALLKSDWQDTLGRKDAEYAALSDQLKRQRDYQARLEQEKDALREQHAQELIKMEERIAVEHSDVEYLLRKLSQPKDHSEIATWVKSQFSGKIVLHQKALDLLLDKSARVVDVELICDAIDFLATDYWDRRYRQLATEDMLTRCSHKYGRPFEVTPVGERAIEFTPSQYRIKYFRDTQGKLRESPLNFHLKVGNDAENLIRIYFLHDDEKQLIVIGSLPRHLRTPTIQ